MPQVQSREDIQSLWADYLHKSGKIDDCIQAVEDGTGYIVLAHDEIASFNPTTPGRTDADPEEVDPIGILLARALLSQPREVFDSFEAVVGMNTAAMRNAMEEPPPSPTLRIYGLPESHKTPELTNVAADHIHSFVQLKGTVQAVTSRMPRIVIAAFECPICHQRMSRTQDSVVEVFQQPVQCDPNDMGGCEREFGKKISPIFHISESLLEDMQTIMLEQLPDGDSKVSRTEQVPIEVQGDLIDFTKPGDKIIVTGMLEARLAGRTRTMDVYLDANHIDNKDDTYIEITFTPEDMETIADMRANPNVLRDIARSIAPGIYGHETIKLALAMQLFGGIPKKLEDGMSIRGDIHILLIGDPSTAKSQLARKMLDYAPRSILAIGGGKTSGVGLTATATQMKKGENERWILEAGAMPKADRGLLVIDEIDKMSKEDGESLLDGLEQQTVTITKASVNQTLRTRFSMLAVGNPKRRKFRLDRSFFAQMDIDELILSRCDAIFPIIDAVDAEKDRIISDHVGSVHDDGIRLERHRRGIAGDGADDMAIGGNYISSPIYTPHQVKIYVAYARQHSFPTMPKQVRKIGSDYWNTYRARWDAALQEEHTMTVRDLEAVWRFSEASARSRIADRVTEKDAKAAIEVVTEMMKSISQAGSTMAQVFVNETDSDRHQRKTDFINAMKSLAKMGNDHPTLDIIRAQTELDYSQTRMVMTELVATGVVRDLGRDKLTGYKEFQLIEEEDRQEVEA